MADVILSRFPDALPVEDFAVNLATRAHDAGFRPSATLLLVGTCRDELCFPLVERLQRDWGPAFQMGSLGGMAFLGRTGLAAAEHHAPDTPGARRYLAVALTHVGVADDGTLGRVRRPGQATETTACGALMAVRDELAAGIPEPPLDRDDLEQWLLRYRLRHLRDLPVPPDALELTLAARDAIRDDLLRVTGELDPEGGTETLLTVGVLVHTASGDFVAARETYRMSGRP